MLKFIEEIAKQAGRILLENLTKIQTIEVKEKNGHKDLVTNIDKEVELFLAEKIESKFPDHKILAEETVDKKGSSDYSWYIDPLDGTTNYIHKNPLFAVSIGVTHKDELAHAVVYNPFYNEMFKAEKNKGAFLNDKKINVTKEKNIGNTILVTGFACRRNDPFTPNFKIYQHFEDLSQGVRRLGSACLDLCYVACGRADGFWEANLNTWDVAAGSLIVKEAGGKVTDFRGGDNYLFGKELIATNGYLHDDIMKEIDKFIE